MERHVKMVHEMIKNYKCESCTKSFFAKADQETYHSGPLLVCTVDLVEVFVIENVTRENK